MTKKDKDADDAPVLTGDEPITAKTIVLRALEGTDLPPLGDETLPEWAQQFEKDKELARRVGELVRAAAVADISAARHWAHQSEDAYLRSQVGGKHPSHR